MNKLLHLCKNRFCSLFALSFNLELAMTRAKPTFPDLKVEMLKQFDVVLPDATWCCLTARRSAI